MYQLFRISANFNYYPSKWLGLLCNPPYLLCTSPINLRRFGLSNINTFQIYIISVNLTLIGLVSYFGGSRNEAKRNHSTYGGAGRVSKDYHPQEWPWLVAESREHRSRGTRFDWDYQFGKRWLYFVQRRRQAYWSWG